MPHVDLHVQLLSYTQNPREVIYVACRQCYSPQYAGDLFAQLPHSQEQEKFIQKIMDSGHQSPLEHVSFTFAVEGVSRAATHQLVRHRIASYSQQSQRYVEEDHFDYIIPPSLQSDPHMQARFIACMEYLQKEYQAFIEYFKSKGIQGERASQDARFVLPNACQTKIVVTMNARELVHFFGLRCCARSQWEIFTLAHKMRELVVDILPCVFAGGGAQCERLGYCPELKKFSCGKYPVRGK